MQIDKITSDESTAARDQRVRTAHEDKTETRRGADRVERPEGGPTRPPATGENRGQEPGARPFAKEDEARRRRARAALAEFVRLPADTELDLDVDVQLEQVTFLIRDRRTGELVRSIPETDAQGLLDKLREFSGSFVDRAL
jgi:uncharacterized FlaG/YvyC family protein